MNALLNIAIDTGAQPPVSALTFTEAPITRMSLGDPHTVLAMCADGAMLACMYQPASALFHLMRRDDLMPVLMRLASRSPWSYLLVDGSVAPMGSGKTLINGDPTGFEWAATQGMLLSIQELGIGVLTLQDTKHLGDTIYRLAKRNRGTSRVRPPKDVLFVTPAEDLLMSLPGIGDERCAQVLRYTGGNAAAALDALTDPRQTVPGIGAETKKKIRRALGLSDLTRLALLGLADEEAMFHEDQNEHNTTSNHAHVTA